VNFNAPVADRFNRWNTRMAARLAFGAPSKLEGDLKRVEVDLLKGPDVLETRMVDFEDKTTIHEGNSDELALFGEIGVEGYKKSDMILHGRTDLRYGVVVTDIPKECSSVRARVIDVGGDVVSSGDISILDQQGVDATVNFEDGQMPPKGWTALTSSSGSGTMVENVVGGAHSGLRSMRATDESVSENTTQRAAIELSLPKGPFEWVIEAWLKPLVLDLEPTESVYVIHLLSGSTLSVAARIQNADGLFKASLVANAGGGDIGTSPPKLTIRTAPGENGGFTFYAWARARRRRCCTSAPPARSWSEAGSIGTRLSRSPTEYASALGVRPPAAVQVSSWITSG
jgi:hypothetical protein